MVEKEITPAGHELKDASDLQSHDIEIDTEEEDAFKQKSGDMHKAAKLEGKLAASQKKSAAGKAVAAVEDELHRLDTQEAGIALGEHALHKDQAAEVELLAGILEEEHAIGEAEKEKHAVGTLLGHAKADLVSESRLRAKIGSETSELVAAAHAYVIRPSRNEIL